MNVFKVVVCIDYIYILFVFILSNSWCLEIKVVVIFILNIFWGFCVILMLKIEWLIDNFVIDVMDYCLLGFVWLISIWYWLKYRMVVLIYCK